MSNVSLLCSKDKRKNHCYERNHASCDSSDKHPGDWILALRESVLYGKEPRRANDEQYQR